MGKGFLFTSKSIEMHSFLFFGARKVIKILAFLLAVAAAIGYAIAAIILLSDGVKNAVSGSCCMPSSCNPYALPTSIVKAWFGGGSVCHFTASDAAVMGCSPLVSVFSNCSVSNSGYCSVKTAYGTTLATGIVGIILAVAMLIGILVFSFVENQPRFVPAIFLPVCLALTITEIVLAGIVFHWQINDISYTFETAKHCAVKVNKNCVSYNYADWQWNGGGTGCALSGSHSYVFGWNIAPESLVKPAAVLLFLPVGVIFCGAMLFLSHLLCPKAIEKVAEAIAEPSFTAPEEQQTTAYTNNKTTSDNCDNIYGSGDQQEEQRGGAGDIYRGNAMPSNNGELQPVYPDNTRV